MTAIAALFIKSRASVGQKTLFHKMLLDNLGWLLLKKLNYIL